MSMLSEQRRKTKWVINPTKKPIWSTESSGIKFGKELMEKMGWSAGKGLGLKEQGIQEPLRVSFKNDTKGMGFKGNDDDWIEHQDEFNSLLSQLRGGDDSTDVKDSDVGKSEIKSLEEKSKSSKARVHYQKFTRGKDLSKYSENDLACILGTAKTKKEKPKPVEFVETDPKTDRGFETSFGVTTINSGSICDYFKKKWSMSKVKSHNTTNENNDTSETSVPSFSNNESCFFVQEDSFNFEEISKGKKSSKKKHTSRTEEINEEESSKSDSGELENIEKTKKKRKNKNNGEINSEEPKHKKKRKDVSEDTSGHLKDFSCENDIVVRDDETLGHEEQKDIILAKKQKKASNHEITNDKSKSGEENSNDSTYQCVSTVEKMNDFNGEVKLKEKSVKEKKRKDKKEAMQMSVENLFENSDKKKGTHLIDSCLEIETVKRKKKKKVRSEVEIEKNCNSSTHIQDSVAAVEDLEMKTNENVEEVEEEVIKKKKKKKKEKSKDYDEKFTLSNQEVPSNHSFEADVTNTVNGSIEGDVSEPGFLKKKKKKKDKKGKLDENVYNNPTGGENISELCEENNVVGESAKKKKKKKKGKEKKCAAFQTQLIESEDSESINRKNKKKKLKENVIQDNKADVVDATKLIADDVNVEFVTKTEGEKRIDRLKVNLFKDAAAQKYFPEERPSERVLKLIKWANISEFKGANLRDVEGYGRPKICVKQSR